MEMPQFGQQQNQFQQYHQDTSQAQSKLKVILIGVGVIILLIVVAMLVFGGGSKGGELEMKKSLQATSDALGIIDKYESELTVAQTKNDVALSQILIRGNFQKLNELYNTTYKPKKKLSPSPKADKASITKLDASKRNNTLDADIIETLKPKVAEAEKQLKLAKSSFSKKDSVEKIKVSIADLNSIEDILNKPQ